MPRHRAQAIRMQVGDEVKPNISIAVGRHAAMRAVSVGLRRPPETMGSGSRDVFGTNSWS